MPDICPVCGMPVKNSSAIFSSNFSNKTYYFHNLEEKRLFDKNPGLFIKEIDYR